MYPFNAQFPYNLTLRSKRKFAKSFPAAAASVGGCERDAHIGVLEIKCWAKLVTLRLSISKPIRSKVCAKMTSKGNHTLGWRRRPTPPAPHLNPPCLAVLLTRDWQLASRQHWHRCRRLFRTRSALPDLFS